MPERGGAQAPGLCHNGDMVLSARAQERLFRTLIIVGVVLIVGSALWWVGSAVRSQQREQALATLFAAVEQALQQLVRDTGQLPGHLPPTPCLADPEISLDRCEAGLLCSDGAFSNWQGPYLSRVPNDPWGTPLRFDPDYACLPSIRGCGVEAWVRAVVAAGPDQQFDTPDDRVLVLCRQ